MSALTLLEIVQRHCLRRGITRPNTVIANPDETISQMQGLLEEELDELTGRGRWSQLETAVTFVHANLPDYLACGLDPAAHVANTPLFVNMALPMTLWNLDNRLPVAGPASPSMWQDIINLEISAAQFSYRVMQNGLYIYPYISTSPNFKFEYWSASAIQSPSPNYTPLIKFENDLDTMRLPDNIIQAGLSWRWKREKGQPYAEEFRTYEAMVANALGGTTIPGQLSLDNRPEYDRIIEPGLLIAAGNWNVS